MATQLAFPPRLALYALDRPSMRDATTPRLPPAGKKHKAKIIKLLDAAQSGAGRRAPQVFEDWLALVDGAMTSQQALAEAIERINTTHLTPGSSLPPLLQACDALIASVGQWGYHDIVGEIFQEFSAPKLSIGQIFTPPDVAHMMAKMTIGDDEEVESRIEKQMEKAIARAGERDPAAGAVIQAGGWTLTLASLGSEQNSREYARRFFWDKLLPAITPYVEPFTVYDPAVGSGVMHLAAASRFPDWAVRLGWVQFFGGDIDPVCVQMSRINHRLYGFRSRVVDGLTASDAELKELDPVTEKFYRPARDARRRGDQKTVQAYIDESRRAKAQAVAQQVALFGGTGSAFQDAK